MARTTVSLALPYTFCDEGKYIVSLNGKQADVTVEYIQTTETLDKITGMKTTGKMTIVPDDPEGLANFSKIIMQLPFLTPHAFAEKVDFDNAPNIFEETTNECARYLNRLREVIRYVTRRYWIRDIAKNHIRIHSIRVEQDDGKSRTHMLLIPPVNHNFPISIREQEGVNTEIQLMLTNENIIPLPERLYADSLNFFGNGRYQEAIVNSNTALEVAVFEQVKKIAESDGKGDVEVERVVDKIFKPRKFETQVKRAFFGNITQQDFEQTDICKNLREIRDKRGNAIHPGVHFFSESEAKIQLIKIHQVIIWVLSQTSITYP